MYASIKHIPVGRIRGKIIVPTANDLGRKVVAKVDLHRSCRGLDNFAFPDPILLACKTSVNWSRKFGFRLIAESEPTESFVRDEDFLIGKNVDLSSLESESKSERNFTG